MRRHPLQYREGKLSPFGRALTEYLAGGGMLERSKSSLAAELWPQIVGPWYARHSGVVTLKDEELRVYCDSPAVAQQLQTDQDTIVSRLNERLGGSYVARLRPSSVGPRSLKNLVRRTQQLEVEGPSEAELEQIPISDAEQAELEKLATEVPEGELRERWRAATVKYLRLQHWRRLRGFRECQRCGMLHDDLGALCYACQVLKDI